jgi:tetratricopeptide (TPR) repeat protein
MLRRVLLATVGAALLAGGCLYSDPVANNTPRPTRFREAEAQYLAKNFAVARAKFLTVAASEAGPEREFAREAQYYAARCDQNLGNYEAAIRVYNRLLDPPAYRSLEIRALVSRGDISMEVRDYSGAAHDYGRARKVLGEGRMIDDIDHGRLTYQLGLAYYGLAVSASNSAERDARYADADKCFEEYMKRYPQGRFYDEAKRHQSFVGRAPVTTFYVLVGGNSTVKGQAEALAQRLVAKGFQDARVFSESLGGSTVYKVRVGACQIRKDAFDLQRQLKAAGFSGEVCP